MTQMLTTRGLNNVLLSPLCKLFLLFCFFLWGGGGCLLLALNRLLELAKCSFFSYLLEVLDSHERLLLSEA